MRAASPFLLSTVLIVSGGFRGGVCISDLSAVGGRSLQAGRGGGWIIAITSDCLLLMMMMMLMRVCTTGRSSWLTGCFRSSACKYQTKASTFVGSRTALDGARRKPDSSFIVRLSRCFRLSTHTVDHKKCHFILDYNFDVS